MIDWGHDNYSHDVLKVVSRTSTGAATISSSSFVPVTPSRVMDTRIGTGGVAVGKIGNGVNDAKTPFFSSLLTLFASSSTLICCAIPALLVALGAGAVLSTFVSIFPGIVWVSQHKIEVFAFAGVMGNGVNVLRKPLCNISTLASQAF